MKYFIRASSKDGYRDLGLLLDSYKDNARIFACSHEQLFYVAEISSIKILDEVRSLDAVSKLDPETKYYK